MSHHEDDCHHTEGQDDTEHDQRGCGCGCGGSQSGCPDCDPDLFDEHKCRRKGISEQAAYNATTGPALEQAAKDYETARKAYRDKRMAIEKDVAALAAEIDDLVERIACAIRDDAVVRCLDKAFRCVVKQIESCGDDGACGSTGPCDYDGSCPENDEHEVDYNELVKKMSDYERRLAAEKACFEALVKEPDALKERLDAAKAAVDAVKAGLGTAEGDTDLAKLYVAALVARRSIALVWKGFATVQAYVDALCKALTCWTRASEALSELTRCRAVEECKQLTRKEHCARLVTDTADEVLLAYERLCACKHEDDGDEDSGDEDSGDDEGSGDDTGGGDDTDEDPGCGCEHGHDHRRSHHRHRHTHESAD